MVVGEIRSDVEPCDYEEIAVPDSAVPLTHAKMVRSDVVLIRFEAGPVRYRVDGGLPTTTVGWPGFDGIIIQLNGLEKSHFRAVRTGATDGKMRVLYYKSHCRA